MMDMPDNLSVHDGNRHGPVSSDIPVLQAIRIILAGLSTTITSSEQRIIGNHPGEALHDYRISVRKILSLLAYLDGVIPEPSISRFREEFAAVMERTGLLRDLEVCAEVLANYQSRGKGKNIDTLVRHIANQERIQRNRMAKYFHSKKYRRFIDVWTDYVSGLTGTAGDAKRSGFPVKQVVREAIHHSYHKAIIQGKETVNRGTTKSLHKMRKSCKKLRYLLDIFRELLPDEPRKKLMRELKDLQGRLGRIQDIEVMLEITEAYLEQREGRLLKTDKKAAKGLVKSLKKEKKELKSACLTLVEDFPATTPEELEVLLQIASR
jgi:CHAD domain-containing protein